MHGVSRHVVASFSFLYSVCLPPHLSSMSINAVGNEKSKEMGNKKKSLYIIYFSFFFTCSRHSVSCMSFDSTGHDGVFDARFSTEK